jgi:hypothetical protein
MKQKKIISEKAIAAKNENMMAMRTEKINNADTTALIVISPNISSGDSDNMVAMNNKNAPLNEVVVSGYGTQKKKEITRAPDALQGKVGGVQITTVSPYPKDGSEKFDKYVEDNAVPVLDSNGNRIAANILLSFTLNKKGKPSHIKVVESSCKVCEEEAIRLLKDGPDWVGKKGEEGTVRIIF